MSVIRSWRSVLRVKQRRTAQQEEAVQAARAALAARAAEHAAARDELARRVAAHAAACAQLRDMLTGTRTFDPLAAIVRRHHMDDRDAERHTAEQLTQKAAAGEEAARTGLAQARALLQRMEQQLDAVREQLRRALDAQEQAEEDQQDEDAEETAVSRLLALARAVPEGGRVARI